MRITPLPIISVTETTRVVASVKSYTGNWYLTVYRGFTFARYVLL